MDSLCFKSAKAIEPEICFPSIVGSSVSSFRYCNGTCQVWKLFLRDDCGHCLLSECRLWLEHQCSQSLEKITFSFAGAPMEPTGRGLRRGIIPVDINPNAGRRTLGETSLSVFLAVNISMMPLKNRTLLWKPVLLNNGICILAR